MIYSNSSKLLNFALGAALIFGATACSEDDDSTDMTNEPTVATLDVSTQVISQNMVEVTMTEVPSDGWIVIHADNGSNGPVVPAIISEPKWIEAGSNMSVMVQIDANATITDGDQVWVMLHEDTGTKMQYEFDGNNDLDPPFVVDGAPVMSAVNIMSAKINSPDMDVTNNTVVIPEVVAAADGWLVIHNDNGMGGIVLPDVIGKVQVSKGVNTNVTVQLDASVNLSSGQKLFPMLHLDNGQIGVYEFDGASAFDGPEIFGNLAFPGNVIFTSFTVLNVN
ncbi:DUF7282 domain-containing protein [Croceimicrobium hydrocarbonivorans]|uniref:DUF7282 domain-containing protein n=1 Tax=Croceimicrobium hydrocarbonivorans TaxID=2761580 RepID=A0A7H0VIR1_9FLAO|nr:hypothetical protein [Croceimicrobium hydrocarbonivorans]QNR25609.1 hypothetical protein H4K34_07140 [Croceimicrobium hydrocarbonivorans]